MKHDFLDLLCFGAHPDDVEIGMAGTIRKHVDLGYRVGICDLTKAELSSNGTVEIREAEASQAAEILGVNTRINVGLADRGLRMDQDVLGRLVQIIRTYKPKVVFVPYEDDRHPDHGQVSKLVEEAVFTANIRKFQWAEEEQAPHRVQHIYYYFINGLAKPQLLVDISVYMELKKEALLAYESQFVRQAEGVETRLNQGFIEGLEGRERIFGKMINVTFAEGFMSKEPVHMQHLMPEEEHKAGN